MHPAPVPQYRQPCRICFANTVYWKQPAWLHMDLGMGMDLNPELRLMVACSDMVQWCSAVQCMSQCRVHNLNTLWAISRGKW